MCDGIEDLRLHFFLAMEKGMGKEEVAKLMTNIAGPNSLRILRTFAMNVEELGGEEMEEVMKPFMDPSNVLKELKLNRITSDVGLKHVSAMVFVSTSLTRLILWDATNGGKGGYTSLGAELLSNQSLEHLDCKIFGIEDLKAVLDLLMPKVSNGKHNTTLTRLVSRGDTRGQEGVEFLAKMLQKNTSLLHLDLGGLDDLQTKDPHGLEFVLAILEALKSNTSLKTISFSGCNEVGGSKILGSMMDLLLENHCIEDIWLVGTPLAKSGDEEYIRSALSKRKKMRLWDVVQGMANVRSTSGRVFLCGEPYAVMSHFDYWKDDEVFMKRIDEVVVELRSQFEEVLEFDDDKVVFKVDGRRESDARGVFDFMRCHLKRLLGRLSPTICACEDVQGRVAKWNLDRPKKTLLKWDEFCKFICEGVKGLEDGDVDLVKRRKEFVAILLNNGGHIMYNEEGGIVITNPHWFCHDIMGEFLNLCASKGCDMEMVLSNGIISIEHMKLLILRLIKGQEDMEKSFDDILEMMKILQVCYEQDATLIMIPSRLQEKHHSLQWCTSSGNSSFVYVGRRLACKDGRKTMLSAGFFARLQVFLFKKLQCANDQDTYELYQDVIRFKSNGFEVIVEFYCGDIDIVLGSSRSQDEMLAFMDHQVVRHIKHLQEDPTLGCLGVLLEEYILRPACVENLTRIEHRKNQCVCVKDLEVEVARSGFEAIHNWKSCEGLESGYDKVKLLMGGLAWTNLLERRAAKLEKYEMELMFLSAKVPSGMKCIEERCNSSTTTIFGSFQKSWFAPVLAKLDELSSKVDELKEVIERLEKSIKNMESNLLQKVCAKIDKLMAVPMEMQEAQIPKLAYLCKVGKRKLLTKCVPGFTEFHLHLMCENMEGFHEVANQKGCVVVFGTKQTKIMMAMLEWGLKIATVLVKIGAHVACGMGEMVPDWSNGSGLAALVLDTPGVLDGGASISSVELLLDGVREHGRIRVDEGSEAQRWMMDFLEPKCKRRKEFHEMFELTKVRYKCEG